MYAGDIEKYLADLGQELQSRGVQHPVRILMIGGAFMLTQVRNRPTTNDIDVLLKDVADPATSQLYRTFKAAVRTVASRNRISGTWMNDIMSDFLHDIGAVPQGTL